MLERVLILGKGYVGGRFAASLPGSILSSADITDRQAVRQALGEFHPTAVLNCAAKTGRPSIDWCEDHVAETFASNAVGPVVAALECLDRGIFFAHIGSGCVYRGDNGGVGYREADEPTFFGNVYTRSKIASEWILRDLPVLQLRMRLPVDAVPGPRNLITKLARYRKVASIPNSISLLDDFVAAALALIQAKATGIWNVTNPKTITFPRILDLYKEIVDPSLTYEIVTPEQVNAMMKVGRTDCVLNTDKLAAKGIVMPPVEKALRRALNTYAQHPDARVIRG